MENVTGEVGGGAGSASKMGNARQKPGMLQEVVEVGWCVNAFCRVVAPTQMCGSARKIW